MHGRGCNNQPLKNVLIIGPTRDSSTRTDNNRLACGSASGGDSRRRDRQRPPRGCSCRRNNHHGRPGTNESHLNFSLGAAGVSGAPIWPIYPRMTHPMARDRDARIDQTMIARNKLPAEQGPPASTSVNSAASSRTPQAHNTSHIVAVSFLLIIISVANAQWARALGRARRGVVMQLPRGAGSGSQR
jgi:hypothetical protein